jgi:uncharacterized protein with HEPN domain
VNNERERLIHILEAIDRIDRYTQRGRQAFENDELIQNWVVWHLQVIGEAARALPESFRDQYPEVPWTEIIGMRHILVHEYFSIDLDIVWVAVQRDLPRLKSLIQAILA